MTEPDAPCWEYRGQRETTHAQSGVAQRGSMEYTEQYGERACLLVILEEYRKERNYL